MHVSPDAQDLASMVNPTILWVLIVVDGPKVKCTLMLSTCERECLEPEHFEDWIRLIQGPTLTACDATKDQRNLLLHIALAYYRLVSHSPEIATSYYYPFIARLMVAALTLAPDEDAETKLESIIEELRGSLPMTLFKGPHVPPIMEEDEHSFNWILPDIHSYEAHPLFVPNPIPTPTTAAPRDDQAAVDSNDDLPPLIDHDDQGASGAEQWGA